MSTEMLHLDMAMDLDSGRQIDPDVQATLSDFLTYSEHLPSTIARSLFLIHSLNRKANHLTLDIHNLLSTYSNLPKTTADATDAPDPVQLRKDISLAYDSLEKCKRMSAAEAIRLEETVVKDATKLQLVQKKLKAMPLPPERDATPDPGLGSPQLRRNAQAQQQADKRTAQHRTGTAPRVRAQKIMVPGEVLPPPNPDSPPPSDFSPSPSPPPRSPNHDRAHNQMKAGRLQKTPKVPKPSTEPKEASQKPPRVRLPGSSGTNAHSAVAGISTSNALMALTAPPPDALPGSKWLPWKRLTEYEMATLRKRMKKNAIWIPSPAMRNRELKNLGRGVTAMEEAKAAAEASGQGFVDEFDPHTWTDPTCIHITDAQQAETAKMLGPEMPDDNQDAALINRGMRLNEAKKLKREKLKAEEAVRLQEEAAGLQPTTEQNKEKKTPQKAQPKLKSQTEAQAVQSQPQPSKLAESLPTRPDPPAEQQEAVQAPIIEESAPVLEPTAKSGLKQKKQTKPKTASAPETIQTEELPVVTVPAQPEPAAESLTPPETTQSVQPEATTETVTTRKRKRDAATPAVEQPSADPIVESPDVLSLPRNGPQPKKLKLNVTAPPPAETPTITVSTRAIAAVKDVPSPSNANTPAVSSPRISVRQKSQRSQRNSAQPETQNGSSEAAAQTPAANTRATRPTTITLKHSATKAASAEPANTRQSLRRSSIASLPGSANNKLRSPAPGNVDTTADTNTGRRPLRKKLPMGILQAEEYGMKVIVGKPRAASKKKKKTEVKGEAATPVIEDEMIDPDEPRYCICGDVSHGTMIACDNEACEIEWFHLECVGLTELPGRRAKWYCPVCREKLKKGLDKNGIVG
ncbi:hypothetical protein M436DRAFT_41610 [Aureobasidium namibiae CBS 147.97]|uniref:PHD-type domain-containing protein n=1 Tax=Aureobasidium namibiae CBS 147.97 TaxID=1043004 RepID=A0A074WQJ6_9PEZI